MKILIRLLGWLLFFPTLAIMIVPFFFTAIVFGIDKANIVMDKAMLPIMEMTII